MRARGLRRSAASYRLGSGDPAQRARADCPSVRNRAMKTSAAFRSLSRSWQFVHRLAQVSDQFAEPPSVGLRLLSVKAAAPAAVALASGGARTPTTMNAAAAVRLRWSPLDLDGGGGGGAIRQHHLADAGEGSHRAAPASNISVGEHQRSRLATAFGRAPVDEKLIRTVLCSPRD